ncbi:MAG: F-type H+-transporting ATPase subunit delta [Gallionellaceae bacterium]|nr:MAG: F-type H+-transporting ATPase subunit delta [Gallionellaceae bacterium]
MAEAISVARPYTLAAFDQARKLGDLKGWSSLLQAAADAVSHPEVRTLIASPRVLKSQLEDLMLALAGSEAGAAGQNFIRLLVESQRLILLPEIAAMFETMRAEAEKSVDVVVASAFELSEAQKQKIIAAMKNRMGREVRLSCEIDRELLGGIVIRAGDKVIDGSARSHLSGLASALA